MNIAVTAAVLLAVVATAVVTVCQHSETRHLQYRVWRLERRREGLERDSQRLRAAIEDTRTPKRLLLERDGIKVGVPQGSSYREPGSQRADGAQREWSVPNGRRLPSAYPQGFNPGDNFEGGGR